MSNTKEKESVAPIGSSASGPRLGSTETSFASPSPPSASLSVAHTSVQTPVASVGEAAGTSVDESDINCSPTSDQTLRLSLSISRVDSNLSALTLSTTAEFSHKSLSYMDFQSIAKSPPKCHLPMELCREILSRLPVKSLLRFCCVSKSWLSLIKGPDFHRLHLQNFKNNRDETQLLVVQGRARDCVIRCSDTFETNSGILPTLDRSWSIVCYVDGLFLLENWGNLRIWNPSIRKFHDIPTSPQIETSHDIRFRKSEIGLGYDPFAKDYKYVKTVRVHRNQPPLVAVYTLGADSWKIIPFQVKEGSNFDWDFDRSRRAVYLQGNLYFLVEHREGKVSELGSFDMSSEVFRTISLPEAAADWFRASSITLVRNGCSSLALFHYYDTLTMWVFESKSMCWTEAYASGLVVPKFLYLNKNRDILMWWGKQVDLSLATDNSLTLYFSLVSSCNLETKVEKVLLLEKNEGGHYWVPEVYGYIESLVLLK